MRCTNACVGESVPLSLSSATVSAFYTSVTLYTTFNVAAVNGRRLPRSLYLSLSTMSTLSTADKESSHDDSKYDRPITLDGDPVIWDRNPATLRGALKEVELYYMLELTRMDGSEMEPRKVEVYRHDNFPPNPSVPVNVIVPEEENVGE